MKVLRPVETFMVMVKYVMLVDLVMASVKITKLTVVV